MLLIVQNRETQFDAPLYSLIHRQGCFPLTVVYTTPHCQGETIDPELGFAPSWDHLAVNRYPQRTLRNTNPLAIWQLAREIHCQKPVLVVICGYFPRCQLLLAVFLRLLGQRIGLRSDNTLTHTTFHGLRGKLRRLGVGPIQRLFHTWHPVGEQALAYLRSLSGSNRPSYRFAYAVDNDWFAVHSSQSRHNRSQFLAAQGWPEDAFVVLGIMKWSPREDPLTLLEAFKQLHQRVPRARLVLVGDGPLRDEVHDACEPLDRCIHLPGYVSYSQLPDWYGRADVFVHPAPDEPWGVSVTESLACGVPVIAAEGVGAAAEMLDQSRCVSVIANGDAGSLAEELSKLVHDEEELKTRSSACRCVADRWHYRHTIHAFQQALLAHQ
ncbi:glycosyltransferase family 4 protein [Cyanobium sp. BA5m-10]|uniref:glycosyltransferase family 4 protein n=1 Tax=unclassified Cyanobium TaxID=2627006 RepID=UPI0020CE5274|nr:MULTISPECIES: glycosyltransferase family 4 protein [unclassified Cyanobium]MCP9903249.1 glycosyltransferase family 4 protein [Cyanobium sp. BA5m-10]